MQAVFGSSQFLPVPSTSAAAQNSSGMGPSFWGSSTSPVDITQGGRFTDFSINAILRPGPFVRASRTPFRVRFYTEDTELPGPYHKEYVQAGVEVNPISDASSDGIDPSSAWPVVTGQLNHQDLEGDYSGTATGVEGRHLERNDPIPLPYLNNDHEMAADWPHSASSSEDSAQAGPSTSTFAATNDSSLLCRVNSKVLEEILLSVSVDLRVSRGRAENRPNAQFSERPRKVKTTKDGKLRRSARNRNGTASSTVSAGSSGDFKSRNTGPWSLRSSNQSQKIHFSDDNEQSDLNGAETSSLASCSSSEYN